MRSAPVVILETPIEERARGIFIEYIKEPLAEGCPPDQLWGQLEKSLQALEKRLGGKETSEALKLLAEGAQDPTQFEKQRHWIELLLIRYYDKAYTHALKTSEQRVVFRGNRNEVKKWIVENMTRRDHGLK